LEIQGSLEYVQVEPGKWTLWVIAHKVEVLPSQVRTGKIRESPSRRSDWDDDYDSYEDLLVEIDPGFYWDPIQHEYIGHPDGECEDDDYYDPDE
jgi:hypothetical protein